MTAKGETVAADLAARHGFSQAAAAAVLRAVELGGGRQAQFDHPDLGGMGQWSRGGMLMIGDMFNNALKARVGALCEDAAAQLAGGPLFAETGSANARWPAELGHPAATGSQNDMHYAVFPETRRLAIAAGGKMTLYDTADHVITGFSQQQSGASSATFSSQNGAVTLDQLRVITPAAEPAAAAGPMPAAPPAPRASPTAATGEAHDTILAKIEGLAALHAKGVLSDAEYAAKKAELLDRL